MKQGNRANTLWSTRICGGVSIEWRKIAELGGNNWNLVSLISGSNPVDARSVLNMYINPIHWWLSFLHEILYEMSESQPHCTLQRSNFLILPFCEKEDGSDLIQMGKIDHYNKLLNQLFYCECIFVLVESDRSTCEWLNPGKVYIFFYIK